MRPLRLTVGGKKEMAWVGDSDQDGRANKPAFGIRVEILETNGRCPEPRRMMQHKQLKPLRANREPIDTETRSEVGERCLEQLTSVQLPIGEV